MCISLKHKLSKTRWEPFGRGGEEVGTDSEVLSFVPEIEIGSSQGYAGKLKVKRNANGVVSLELCSSPGEGRRLYWLSFDTHGGVLKLAHSSSRERTVHFAQFPSQGSHFGSFKLANAIKQGFPPSPQSRLFNTDQHITGSEAWLATASQGRRPEPPKPPLRNL